MPRTEGYGCRTFVLFFRQTKQALGVRCCLGMIQKSRPLQIVPLDLDKKHLREKGLRYPRPKGCVLETMSSSSGELRGNNAIKRGREVEDDVFVGPRVIKAHQSDLEVQSSWGGAKHLGGLWGGVRGSVGVDAQELSQTRLPLSPWFAVTQKRLEGEDVLDRARWRLSAGKGVGPDREHGHRGRGDGFQDRAQCCRFAKVRPNRPIAGCLSLSL